MAYREIALSAAVGLAGVLGKTYIDASAEKAAEAEVRKGLQPVMEKLNNMGGAISGIAEKQDQTMLDIEYIRGRVDENAIFTERYGDGQN